MLRQISLNSDVHAAIGGSLVNKDVPDALSLASQVAGVAAERVWEPALAEAQPEASRLVVSLSNTIARAKDAVGYIASLLEPIELQTRSALRKLAGLAQTAISLTSTVVEKERELRAELYDWLVSNTGSATDPDFEDVSAADIVKSTVIWLVPPTVIELMVTAGITAAESNMLTGLGGGLLIVLITNGPAIFGAYFQAQANGHEQYKAQYLKNYPSVPPARHIHLGETPKLLHFQDLPSHVPKYAKIGFRLALAMSLLIMAVRLVSIARDGWANHWVEFLMSLLVGGYALFLFYVKSASFPSLSLSSLRVYGRIKEDLEEFEPEDGDDEDGESWLTSAAMFIPRLVAKFINRFRDPAVVIDEIDIDSDQYDEQLRRINARYIRGRSVVAQTVRSDFDTSRRDLVIAETGVTTHDQIRDGFIATVSAVVPTYANSIMIGGDDEGNVNMSEVRDSEVRDRVRAVIRPLAEVEQLRALLPRVQALELATPQLPAALHLDAELQTMQAEARAAATPAAASTPKVKFIHD